MNIMSVEITKEILDQTKGVAVELYKDAMRPIVKPVGEILGFLPRTLKLALSSWEKWLINGEETIRLTAESVREKLQALPVENLVEPEPYVAIPAMQQLSYCVNNEELRELYANLLVSSMNTDKKWQVHPSFVDIIKQITPDEAKLLKQFLPTTVQNYPLMDVRLENQQEEGNVLYSNFTDIGLDLIDVSKNIGLYIDNFVRLKIIEIPPARIYADSATYERLKQHPILQSHVPDISIDALKIKYVYKVFNVTNFGASFINTCCY